MNQRFLDGSVVMVVTLAAVSLSAQQNKGVPLTPWGEPDLQGTYTNQTLTPLERPATLKDKALLTKEEAAALEKRSVQQRQSSEDAPPRPGDVGTYNAFWAEPGTKVVGSLQTSLVVDLGWTRAAQERGGAASRRLREAGI